MRLLITGSKGFVGRNLVSALRSHKVFEWDLADKKDIFSKDFERATRWSDVVIHLAALTNVNESFERQKDFVRVNVLGTARVCELCVKYGKKLIYPSSAAVYHKELSPYAETKALAEDICVAVSKFHPVVILRFFNIYGQGMSSEAVMYQFMKGAHEGKITIYGDGEQTRDFINIKDVVGVITDSLKKKWDGAIVDVGSGEAHSINYIAGLFSHHSGAKLIYKKPRREIKWSIANTQMLKRLYKKRLTTNLERDIEEIMTPQENDYPGWI